jgi:uncharacterized Rmd1/YagE family protein
MQRLVLTAYDLKGELDLNPLARQLGIAGKFRWEEPMVLSPETFSPLGAAGAQARAYLFSFGAIVLLSCPEPSTAVLFRELALYSPVFAGTPGQRCHEEYDLLIDGGAPPTATNAAATLPSPDHVFLQIVAFVLAQSVSLERIEAESEQGMDETEALISRLGRGRFGITDRQLARYVSSILSLRYTSVANIMVLEKPDITWDNEEADRFHARMAALFELQQRYQGIRHKHEILLETTRVFSDLSHARRSARLEWIIIILIFIEIVIYLVELSGWKP